MRENVVVVAQRGCSGLLQLLEKRKDEVDALEVELDLLRDNLMVVEERITKY